MSDKLSTETQLINARTLAELSAVMDTYQIRRADVARILGVSRSLVTRWYRGDKCCPAHAPATIRAALDIPDAESTAQILERYRSKVLL